jgi:hypothetical protein
MSLYNSTTMHRILPEKPKIAKVFYENPQLAKDGVKIRLTLVFSIIKRKNQNYRILLGKFYDQAMKAAFLRTYLSTTVRIIGVLAPLYTLLILFLMRIRIANITKT